MEFVVRVDGKGRVVIPSEVRYRLGIRSAVRMRVEEGRIIIEPIRDPLELLEQAVVRGTRDVEAEISELRRAAEEEARRRLEERWS